MLKRLTLAVMLVAAALVAHPVSQIVIPYTFTAGTVIDPDQMNTNFSTISTGALNRTGGTLTGTLSTQSLVPVTTNLYDLGDATHFWRTEYVRTSLVLGQSSFNYTLAWTNPAAARAITIVDPGGADTFTFNAATQSLSNKTITASSFSGTTVSGTTGTFSAGVSGTTGTFSSAVSGTTGTFTSAVTVNPAAVASAYVAFRVAGVQRAIVGLSGAIVGDASVDATLFAETGGGIKFLVNGSATPVAYINSSGNFYTTAALIVTAGQRLYLDSGSDTFIQEDAANRIAFTAGGTIGLYVQADKVIIPATNKLYLDGGSDTFIYEPSANVIRMDTGGAFAMQTSSTLTTFAGGLSNSTFSGAGINTADLRNTSATGYGTYTAGGGSDAAHYAFYVANYANAQLFGVDGLGNLLLGASGHIADAIATPTIASSTGGTNTIAGRASFFTVTGASGAPYSTTVNFNMTFANVPSCTVSAQNGTVAASGIAVNATTTQVVITAGTAWNLTSISVQCRGY